tara:strand:- start:5400 stop:5579 length:180 start_codon:yes stop_codon:yes gene_type:complete
MKRQSTKQRKHDVDLFSASKRHEMDNLKKDIHKGWVYFWTRRGYSKNIKFTTDVQIKKI